MAAHALRPRNTPTLSTQVISSGGTHAAMNWWFHPPDTADFARPYASRFWPRDWEERMALEGAKTDDGRA